MAYLYIPELCRNIQLFKKMMDPRVLPKRLQNQDISLILSLSGSILKDATHYLLTDRSTLSGVTGKLTMDDIQEQIRLLQIRMPYDSMTLSFDSIGLGETGKKIKEKPYPSVLLMHAVESANRDLAFVVAWSKIKPIHRGMPELCWIPSSEPILVSLSGNFKDRPDRERLAKEFTGDENYFDDYDLFAFLYNDVTFSESMLFTEIFTMFFPFLLASTTPGIGPRKIVRSKVIPEHLTLELKTSKTLL